MYVNNLSKVALDSAAAGIEPAISSRKSNALTTTPPSHTKTVQHLKTSHFEIHSFKRLGKWMWRMRRSIQQKNMRSIQTITYNICTVKMQSITGNPMMQQSCPNYFMPSISILCLACTKPQNI